MCHKILITKPSRMRKVIKEQLLVFSILVVSIGSLGCKKEATDGFCKISRSEYLTITNKEGIIVYSSKHNRYGISLKVTTANNIDTQVIGFVCDLKQELRTIGLLVRSSGTLRHFNIDENIKPEIAGQELYYFETSQITKE